MVKRKCSLEDDLQAVFERACLEQDVEIAEYLLQALEAFALRSGSDEKLKRIYLTVASSLYKSH